MLKLCLERELLTLYLLEKDLGGLELLLDVAKGDGFLVCEGECVSVEKAAGQRTKKK